MDQVRLSFAEVHMGRLGFCRLCRNPKTSAHTAQETRNRNWLYENTWVTGMHFEITRKIEKKHTDRIVFEKGSNRCMHMRGK